MVFLGILFDTLSMTLHIPLDKIKEVLDILTEWQRKTSANRHQLQCLLGKLHHIAKCVRPARLFVSRMLDTLREAPPSGHTGLDQEFRKDLSWFQTYMPQCNGVSMMYHPFLEVKTGHSVDLDACLTGCGGVYGMECYAAQFPAHILSAQHPIHRLEMLNAVVAAPLWGSKWAHSTVTLCLDNIACVFVLESGRSRDTFLLQCARELWLCAAQWDFEIFPRHISGKMNVIADALSRLHIAPHVYNTHLEQSNTVLQMLAIPDTYFDFSCTI